MPNCWQQYTADGVREGTPTEILILIQNEWWRENCNRGQSICPQAAPPTE